MRTKGEGNRKRRGILLLTLIVLVWNAALFARHSFFGPSAAPPVEAHAGPYAPAEISGAADDGTSGIRAVGAGTGSMTPRQRFLLGDKVDVNRDPWERITGLPGLSDRVARDIVAHRARHGRFRRAEDLLGVRGIKEKRLQKILPFLAPFHNN